MASSSQLFLNTKDSNLNVYTPILTWFNSSMNVQMLLKKNRTLQTPDNVTHGNVTLGNVAADDVEDVFGVDTYVSKLYLINLEKQHAT
jgi:hypothetical protein